MSKLKVMTIVGTRPELIRLSEIIKKADRAFEHVFVHTGQNYSDCLNDIFYDDLELRRPDYYLGAAEASVGKTIGNIISSTYGLMRDIRPDALLILGDTNSALSAIAAKRLKIPIFHMEAGNRCFDENLPEEINRRIVDHIADVSLPYTEHARRYLLSEGVRRDFIFVTGSPMREVIEAHKEKIEASKVLDKLGLEKNKYIVLSAHREENIDDENNFISLMNAINVMAEEYKMPIIYSLHPRSEKRIVDRKFEFHELVKKMTPFNFSDYSALMRNAYCVVSDSGTISEEAAISGFPGVSIRTSTERPEALEQGQIVIGGIDSESVIRAINVATSVECSSDNSVTDYASSNVSSTIIKIIQSYTSIVNSRIWRK